MASVSPTNAANLNVNWNPSPVSFNDATPGDVNSSILREKEVKVDVNDYSRFKDIGADLQDEDEECQANTTAASSVTPSVDTCRNCSKSGAKLKCSVCKKVVYCARKCQASDWQFHKRTCKKPEVPKKSEPLKSSSSGSSSTKKTATLSSSSKSSTGTSSSSVVVADEPDLPEDMRGYKNGLPYFHRELSKEEKSLIGDIAPQKIETKRVEASSVQHDGSAWNTAGTFEERVVTKWAEEKWSEIFTGATYVEGEMKATLKAPERITGDASICVVRGKKRYLFDFNFKLPFEVSVSGGGICKGSYEMKDISNDEEYEISCTLTKKLSDAREQSVVQAFVAKRNIGLQKELVRLIGMFASSFQQQ